MCNKQEEQEIYDWLAGLWGCSKDQVARVIKATTSQVLRDLALGSATVEHLPETIGADLCFCGKLCDGLPSPRFLAQAVEHELEYMGRTLLYP